MPVLDISLPRMALPPMGSSSGQSAQQQCQSPQSRLRNSLSTVHQHSAMLACYSAEVNRTRTPNLSHPEVAPFHGFYQPDRI